MTLFYTLIVHIIKRLLPVAGWFYPKIRPFYKGRQSQKDYQSFDKKPHDKVIWMHCASLGEFEQGRPVLEKLKEELPTYKILLTFFSPSGYEIRKNYDKVAWVCYLPWDTPRDVNIFLDYFQPDMALFVKYEIWPNTLRSLKKRQIPTVLFSGIFRAGQPYFKYHWFKQLLHSFDMFFVQDERSLQLLQDNGIKHVSLSGDTRFDRVYDISRNPVDLPLIQAFVNHHKVLVAGSTWPKDEALLVQYINQSAQPDEKFIIAPHVIDESHILQIERSLTQSYRRYSRLSSGDSVDFQVLIIDSIGLLSQLYRFAQLAYIGGGFGVGIHNILEAATYGVPILIGPNYQKFKEAKDLIQTGACISVDSVEQGVKSIERLMADTDLCHSLGQESQAYISAHTGATSSVVNYVLEQQNMST
ncbi:MAG: 3-deoxy-D-manno-octulosonic acid transferase [Flavobacteriales bacterium]|nr:MAG: 3-deoxy-D-manno-octulosonic acid transferase [Flavobacteriales bacterium]